MTLSDVLYFITQPDSEMYAELINEFHWLDLRYPYNPVYGERKAELYREWPAFQRMAQGMSRFSDST